MQGLGSELLEDVTPNLVLDLLLRFLPARHHRQMPIA
jgi:hypothetical protein